MIFKLAILQDNLELLTKLIRINVLEPIFVQQFKEIVEIAATSNSWDVLDYCLKCGLYQIYEDDPKLKILLSEASTRREKRAKQATKEAIINYFQQNKQTGMDWLIEDDAKRYISLGTTQDIDDIFNELLRTKHKNSFLLNEFVKAATHITTTCNTKQIFLHAVEQNNLQLVKILIHADGLQELFNTYFHSTIQSAANNNCWPMLYYWISHTCPIHNAPHNLKATGQTTLVTTLYNSLRQLKKIQNPSEIITKLINHLESYFKIT
jgi:hypothetical protein